jgi:hypothetical protein
LASQILVIHERIGFWARQLRPRLSERPVRLIETRSSVDLETAITGAGVVYPVVLLDLAHRVRAGLDDLQRVSVAAPEALVLVLDPQAHEGVALLAREAGATHVMSGPVTPPEVEGLLGRWLGLAQRRGELDGWASVAAVPAEPEPWSWLTPLLSPKRIP